MREAGKDYWADCLSDLRPSASNRLCVSGVETVVDVKLCKMDYEIAFDVQ